MSHKNAAGTPRVDRDAAARAIEERARRRRQEEFQHLRNNINRIRQEDYRLFLSRVGDQPKYANGVLVEWQILSIAAQAITLNFRSCPWTKSHLCLATTPI
jgi:hypothetical protein